MSDTNFKESADISALEFGDMDLWANVDIISCVNIPDTFQEEGEFDLEFEITSLYIESEGFTGFASPVDFSLYGEAVFEALKEKLLWGKLYD